MKHSAVWPVVGPRPDPHRTPWWPADRGLQEYRALGGTLPTDELLRRANAFVRTYEAVLGGEATLDELRERAAAIDLHGRPKNDRRHARPAPWVPDAAVLARIATDLSPGIGAEAPWSMLGPWADGVLGHDVLRATIAHMGFVPHEPGVGSPQRNWSRWKPTPPVEERAAMGAVGWAPLSLWEWDDQTLVDRLGLGPRWLPDGPVVLQPLAVVGGTLDDGTVAARVVPGPDGYVAVAPLLLPGRPPADLLARWVELVLLELRLGRRRASLEDALRVRGHVIVRWAAERECELARREASD